MMTLKSYLEQSGEKQAAFANRIGSTTATVSRLCAGKFRPSLELAHEIERATNGNVPTEIWIDSAQPSTETAGAEQ